MSNSCCALPSWCCSDHSHSVKVAKPSFSQMSRHRLTETLSPNHWCACSCTITDMFEPPAQNSREYTGRVCVSMAKPKLARGATPPTASNGYGPHCLLSQDTTEAVRLKSCLAYRPAAPPFDATAVITGSPEPVLPYATSNCPTAMNAR